MRILLFDIDGTLIRSGGAGRLALLDTMQSVFSISEPGCDINFSGQTDGYLLQQVLSQNDVMPSLENMQRLVEGYLQRLPTWLRRCEGEVLPGVVTLLDRLQAEPQIEMGCMTGNLATSARLKLQHFGLWDGYFDEAHLFSGDECQGRDQMALAAAMQLAERFVGLDLDLWVIGDTPKDIQCARAMGAKVLACCTGEYSRQQLQPHQPDHLFGDLSDVDAIAAILSTSGFPA
ncbi:HAD family hydrolase [Roseimaritima ulvae]|uniref:phosphoglycolate phosphatase n=1 Tax=Roseimaritima ulvae TaxID=980254 RepID=A0A5B9R0H2_9BACT|nr:HAD hydrolase-like protein [Roseimaritima ulvae]QEG43225.1 Phosphoglycolate phosphatase [Roseimaritima ulvae]